MPPLRIYGLYSMGGATTQLAAGITTVILQKKSGPESQRVSTKGRNAPLWPVLFKKVPVVSLLPALQVFTILRTRLAPQADTCFLRGYPLTPATLEGSAGCSGSGDFPFF